MKRRQLIQGLAVLPLVALVGTAGAPTAEAGPLWDSNDIRKETLLIGMLHWDLLPFSAIEPHLEPHKWRLLEQRAHTKEGREEVARVFDQIAKDRFDHVWDRYGVYRGESLLKWHVTDARYYFAFRRYLNEAGYPLPNLRLEAQAITRFKSLGLMDPESEVLSSQHTFEMTWEAVRHLGWQHVYQTIVPDHPRKGTA